MTTASETDDAFLWLEEVQGERALAWVRAQTARTEAALCDAAFDADRARIKSILESADNIPYVGGRGGYLYNHWQDATHSRGLWRRTTLESFKTENPDWDVILDIDALGKAEGEDWVFGGATALPPAYDRALIRLSRGGSDASVNREFDLSKRAFVDGGFALPEAKGNLNWLDRDTLLVASSLGEGMTTTSGYARTVRRWRRGTPFEQADIVFEVGEKDMSAGVTIDRSYDPPQIVFTRVINFFAFENWLEHRTRGRVKLDLPNDAWRGTDHGWMIVRLRSDWTVGDKTYSADALLALDLERFLDGARDFQVLFEPGPRRVLSSFSWSKGHLALSILDNVRSQIVIATPMGATGEPKGGAWTMTAVGGLDQASTLGIYPRDSLALPDFFVTASSFVAPPALYHLVPGAAPSVLKRQPAKFDASALRVTQHEAVSSDGERIPYFQIAPRDVKNNGDNPTILYGYGGFEVSMLPSYMAATGAAWLEKGGVFVMACIRGGGEFGARWHKAGIREGKRLAHDDFAAIARDLIARKVTSPQRLAANGGSNGGLLVGNMLTRYPELFGAIQCSVPLLDMRRYSKLLAGASWMAEYGDPDKPGDWAFMQRFSAYQAVETGKAYPPTLFITSAKDDRVHPGHARKMAAKMQVMSYAPYFYEPAAGGHGFADKDQEAAQRALFFAFLRHTIMKPPTTVAGS